MEKKGCSDCTMRARYDRNPRSLIGRIWRWHIGFCPGWKAYMKSLSPEERSAVEKKYSLGKPR
jgi:hypothetical protein